jgi:hypothetical protein
MQWYIIYLCIFNTVFVVNEYNAAYMAKGRIPMKFLKLLNLSNLSLAAAAVTGSYVLASTYIIKRSLPANACALQSYDKWIYITIVLAIVSVLTDGLGKKKERIKRGVD